jgi:outer membrane protein assembly factor BamA
MLRTEETMRIVTGLLLLCSAAVLCGQTPVSQPSVAVQSVAVTSDSSVSSQHLEQIKEEVLKHTYRPDREGEIAERAKYELMKDGYFTAQASTANVQVLGDTPAERSIAVTLRINEGQQYRLKEIVFLNNKVFAGSQLRKQFSIADGDIFDAEKIRNGFEAIREAYAEKGYVNVVPVPGTVADQSGWVKLIVDMDEGRL